jgi:hypothetical protein
MRRIHFFGRLRLWFHESGSEPIPGVAVAENTFTLRKVFYKEIDQHRIPVDREVIAAFAYAPGVLDFYVQSASIHAQPALLQLATFFV